MGKRGTSDNTSYKPTTTTSTYDPTGRRVAITENTPISGGDPITRLRYFSFDADGNIATRRDGTLDGSTFTETANSRQHFTYVNGQQLAAYGEDGHLDAASQLTAFDSSDVGAEPTLVLEGDTLQSIAQRVYGNPNLWYVLAAANAVSDADLVAGTTLKAPQVKTTANDASTFKPYDPNSITGPTTPSLPYISAPPQQHCNALATVLMVVVAVVVAYFTAGAATAAMGVTTTTTAAGAVTTTAVAGSFAASAGVGVATAVGAGIGGVAGSIASQAVGSAMGVTSFSWRQVASDGITAALSAGVTSGLSSSKAFTVSGSTKLNTAGRVLQGLGSYGGSVVARSVVGRDANFSWTSVAATAIGSYLGAKINPGGTLPLTKGSTEFGKFVNDFGGGYLNGTLSATSRRLFGQGEQDWRQIGVDAFGNALGNTLQRINSPDIKLQQAVQDQRDAAELSLGERLTTGQLRQGLVDKGIDPTYTNMLRAAVDRGLISPEALAASVADAGTEDKSTGYAWATMEESVANPDAAWGKNPNQLAESIKFTLWANSNNPAANLPLLSAGASIYEIAEVNELYLAPYAHPGSGATTLPPVAVFGSTGPSWGQQWNGMLSSFSDGIINDLDDAAVEGNGNWLTAAAAFVRTPARSGLVTIQGVLGLPTLLDSQVRHDIGSAVGWAATHPGAVVDGVERYFHNHSWGEIAADAYVGVASTLMGGRIGSGTMQQLNKLPVLGEDVRMLSETLLQRFKSSEGFSTANLATESNGQALIMAAALREKFLASGIADSALVRNLAEQSTVKFPGADGLVPDRLVLGAFAADPSYATIAEAEGGTIFHFKNGVFKELTSGLSPEDQFKLAWSVNREVLDMEMQRGVSRIDFVTGDPYEDLITAPNSFRAQEIRYVVSNAGRYGYVPDGNSWFLGAKP